MTDWVRMKHSVTGGVTLVTRRAVESYRRRGWSEQGEDFPPATTPATQPAIKSKSKDTADKPESDSNESKEDG